jgi:predicted ribosomally synthesized peptide with nif11-like leader
MNKNLIAFSEKLVNDPELGEKMSACKSPDEAYAIASAVQDGFTKEEFVETMTEILNVAKGSELSREDLLKVSGGTDCGDYDSTITTCTVSPVGPIAMLSAMAGL